MNLLLLGFPVLNFASREAMFEARACEGRQTFVIRATVDASFCSVVATVQRGLRLVQLDHAFEATDLPRLNAQSPSQRWDGDCALRCEALSSFVSKLSGGTHTRPNWTVAATEGAYLISRHEDACRTIPKEEST